MCKCTCDNNDCFYFYKQWFRTLCVRERSHMLYRCTWMYMHVHITCFLQFIDLPYWHTLQHITPAHCNTLPNTVDQNSDRLQHAATHCNPLLQHTAMHSRTLHQTITTRLQTVTHWHFTPLHSYTLLYTTTTLPHTAPLYLDPHQEKNWPPPESRLKLQYTVTNNHKLQWIHCHTLQQHSNIVHHFTLNFAKRQNFAAPRNHEWNIPPYCKTRNFDLFFL